MLKISCLIQVVSKLFRGKEPISWAFKAVSQKDFHIGREHWTFFWESLFLNFDPRLFWVLGLVSSPNGGVTKSWSQFIS